MISASGNAANLCIGGHIAHNSKHLTRQHHAHPIGEDAFHCAAVVVVIAIEPTLMGAGVDPLMALQPACQPDGLALQVVCQITQPHPHPVTADLMLTAAGILFQQLAFGFHAVENLRLVVKQYRQFLQNIGLAGAGNPLQQADEAGQLPQIASVSAGKGHALPMLRGHIQCIVPVCPAQAVDVMGTYLIKGCQLLNQQMLQNTAGINFALPAKLPASLLLPVKGVNLGASHRLGVLEIRYLPVEDTHVAGLIDVQLCGHLRPQGMIHPHPRNAVAVCDKIAIAVADDSGVGSVYAYAAKVLLNHPAHIPGIHQQKGQAILPQVTPAAAAAAVVMVRQKRTAKQPAQKRLEADPLHQVVKGRVPGAALHINLLPPVRAGGLQCGLRLIYAAVSLQHLINVLFTVLDA